MSWYLIELPDGALTPYATETEGGTLYGWGDMPKKKVDLDALLKIADDLDSDGWAQFSEETVACEDVDGYEQSIADRIRKAVEL